MLAGPLQVCQTVPGIQGCHSSRLVFNPLGVSHLIKTSVCLWFTCTHDPDKLDTGPSWMWVNAWRGRLQPAGGSKRAPLPPRSNPGAAIRRLQPISRSNLLSIIHTHSEQTAHTLGGGETEQHHIYIYTHKIIIRHRNHFNLQNEFMYLFIFCLCIQ